MANCNVCDGAGPHPEPCDCPCHGSRAVVNWLASPEGEAWSRQTFAPVDASQFALFAAVLPQPWGKPWRPFQADGSRRRRGVTT
jgi:hypothetical protein